jgi:hypothetical protein
MRRDQRRIRPVKKPGREAVMLGQRNPVPKVLGLVLRRAQMRFGILYEIAKQVLLQIDLFTAVSRQAW